MTQVFLRSNLEDPALIDSATNLWVCLKAMNVNFHKEHCNDVGWAEDPEDAAPELRKMYDDVWESTLAEFRGAAGYDESTWLKVKSAVMEVIVFAGREGRSL